MIKIKKITSGRFGNRVLQYNSAYQLSLLLETSLYCVPWEGEDFFISLPSRNLSSNLSERLFTFRDVLSFDWQTIKTEHLSKDLLISEHALHNFYFQLTNVHPRNFLQINEKYLPSFYKDSVNIGIHIRGGDILGADGNNGREIHSFEYYKNAIDEILKEKIADTINIATDDTNFSLFKDVVRYANSLSLRVNLGKSTLNPSLPHFYDLALLAYCDYLIASSSTYSICAGFLGKPKKIIHSSEWIKKNIPGDGYFAWGKYTNEYPEEYWKSYDNFWLKVNDGGNQFYRPWKII